MTKKVAVIDDDPVQVFILKKYLEEIGVSDCLEFHNGLDAINYFRSISVEEFPDHIFLDLKMPVMNGFEMLKIFQEEIWAEGLACKLTVLTTSLRKEDRMLSYSFDCVSDFITKPISLERLHEIILSDQLESKEEK